MSCAKHSYNGDGSGVGRGSGGGDGVGKANCFLYMCANVNACIDTMMPLLLYSYKCHYLDINDHIQKQ